MNRQRVYINPAYADVLSLLGKKKGLSGLGFILESVVEEYLQQNDIELKELLDDKKRNQR